MELAWKDEKIDHHDQWQTQQENVSHRRSSPQVPRSHTITVLFGAIACAARVTFTMA
jgi:hypothetical protein